ncbi:MAG: efflux RND transporter periplasmic adaptor subunit [Bacteroidia bacterium]|nr:efflux RND transporter periplasmic adaptor subunit [Bacteroidia bacterium]
MKKSAIILLSVLLVNCSNKEKPSESATPIDTGTEINLSNEQIAAIGLGYGKIEMDTISAILKVNGKIDVPPQNMVSVSVPLGGYLKSTQLLPGMKVNKGEVIATFEDPQYIQLQQDFLSVKAKINYSENEYQRQKELNANKTSSDKVFQQAEAEYLTQKIALKSLSEKLRLINVNPEQLNENNISRSVNVFAPIDGYVSKINANIGKYVNPADVVFELVNPSDIHLALTVFEKDIDKLYIGQKLVAFTNNNLEKKHACEILLIGQNLSNERSIEVHCHFKNYDKSLIPGMYMNAEIDLTSAACAVLPEDAILNYEGRNYVFVEKQKNKFVLTEVKTGNSEKGRIEILNATEINNSSIVVKGAYQLLMGLKNKQE